MGVISRLHRAAAALLLCVGAALLLCACAALGPRITPPGIAVLDVRLDRIEGTEAWFVATAELTNPNADPLAVDTLDATLSIEGEVVSTAALAAPARIPPGGSARADIVARTGVDAILRAVASAMRRPASGAGLSPNLHYVLEGSARLANGFSVPFRRSGEVGSRPARK
jgi:LEA14-like dessication related protein